MNMSHPVLPAPLYFLPAEGQIMRLERDGATVSQATREPAPVTDYDVAGDAIAYVSAGALHLADAAGRRKRVLLRPPQPPAANARGVASVRLSPTCDRVAFALGGVQVLDIASGDVRAILPNAPPDSPGAGVYTPLAWSAEGDRLLVHRAYFNTPGLLLVCDPYGAGAIVLGDACCHPSWTPDGEWIYLSGPYYGMRAQPGLRRANSRRGGVETLIAGDSGGGDLRLVAFARQLADGRLYSFQSATTKPAYSQANTRVPFQMTRTLADGVSETFELRAGAYFPLDVLWAADGSGAVICERPAGAETTSQVLWLPAGAGPSLVLPATTPVDFESRLRWGALE